MCAQDNGQRVESKENGFADHAAEVGCSADVKEAHEELSDTDDETEFDNISTTGVICVMKANGRKQVAELVEELHDANKKISETQAKAEKLLLAIRRLHQQRGTRRKRVTGTNKLVKENQ